MVIDIIVKARTHDNGDTVQESEALFRSVVYPNYEYGRLKLIE
jgi:hypothetical protein